MRRILWLTLLVIAGAAAAVWWRSRAPEGAQTVVVYVSHDEVFSEPILNDFEKETGIRVRAVYDTEETKSAGTMNRLIAEKNNPQADVYWANEPIRAEVLRQQHIATPYLSPNAAGIADVPRSTGILDRLRGEGACAHRTGEPRSETIVRVLIHRPPVAQKSGDCESALWNDDRSDRSAFRSIGR